MTTAYDIVRKAMQKAGILFKTEAPSADEINDGLYSFNSMLLSWSNETNMRYARILEEFALVGGQVEYTMGPGGDFDTVRPLFITDAHIRQDTLDYDLTIIPDQIYQGYISMKSLQGIPLFINNDNQYPLIKLRLYPVPDQNYPIFILSEKEISTFTLYQDIILPPGWERALIYNLAIEIAPEYGVQVDPAVVEIATMAKDEIARQAMRNITMDSNPQNNFTKGNVFNGWYNYR